MNVTARYKKLRPWGAAAIILIILFIVLLYFSPAIENQLKTKAEQRPAKDNHRQTLREVNKNMEISEEDKGPSRLIKEMQYIDETYRKELMQHYPLGYTLFAVKDGEKIITLSKNQSQQRCILDWDNAEIADLTDSHINIMFPSLYDNKNGNIFTRLNLFVPRKAGIVHSTFKIHNLRIVTESLIDSNEGIICLLGLKEDKESR